MYACLGFLLFRIFFSFLPKYNFYSVAGGWSGWQDWGSCSTTCGPGTRTRTRLCDNPSPIHGGAVCPGDGTETEDCQDAMCPGECYITLWHGIHVPWCVAPVHEPVPDSVTISLQSVVEFYFLGMARTLKTGKMLCAQVRTILGLTLCYTTCVTGTCMPYKFLQIYLQVCSKYLQALYAACKVTKWSQDSGFKTCQASITPKKGSKAPRPDPKGFKTSRTTSDTSPMTPKTGLKAPKLSPKAPRPTQNAWKQTK